MTAPKGFHSSDLFSKLTVDEIKRLDEVSFTKDFAEGESVFEFNQACSHLYMLMEGTVHLMLPSGDGQFDFAFAKVAKNEIFGLSSLMKSPRYTAAARSMTSSRVLMIEADPLIKILEQNQVVGFDIINAVSRIYYHRYLSMLRKLKDIVDHALEIE
ncbi:MAG TPA: cyclic nucleotide-binding domain-containing protein [Bacteroidetes bacterium]|nr:transcriptional activator FtrB [bacterium BMS3Bbin04]HDO64822.1 cyclic nucleotide-binding domain-containing protein [Bacteroidota bacterium]HEX03947.1 cyclic nucleotide-binding domain-containing protein [Bacteroidota bacterium]